VPPAKSRRKKVIRMPKAAPRGEPDAEDADDEPAEEPAGPKRANARSTGGDWADLADKASRKVRELADKAMPKAKEASESARRMAVDVSEGFDGAFARVSERARDLMSKGQHTRVRIKFRGKQLTELPIAVVAAAEAATFWWFGPLRLVLGHVVGKAVLDVEFVSNADANVAQGRAFLADGELAKAIAEFDKALAMDRRCASALLGKGIALKLRGDRAAARKWFEDAEEADPRGEPGREARRHLDNL
jgi:tetratricopeptide (TPR) repeat protein